MVDPAGHDARTAAGEPADTAEVVGSVRVAAVDPALPDASSGTRSLAGRLLPGEVAVLDHLDIDAESARALLDAGVAAVLEVPAAWSGRGSASGLRLLLAAGVPVIDGLGPSLLVTVRDGDTVRVCGDTVERLSAPDDEVPLRGRAWRPADLPDDAGEAAEDLVDQLAGFGADLAGTLAAGHAAYLRGEGLPGSPVDLVGRPVLVVGPGPSARDDLARLRAWQQDRRPVIVAAGTGAVAAAEHGRVHLVVGETGPLSGRAEKRLRGVPRVPGDPRLGSPADVAVLLARHAPAEVVVVAGPRTTLPDLLADGRHAAASGVAARLGAGAPAVDATAAASVHRPAVTWPQLLVLLVAGLAALLVALGTVRPDLLGGAWPW